MTRPTRRASLLLQSLESRTLLTADFTLATFSDTQYTVESFPQTFSLQTVWIAAHKTDPNYKVAFFTHQGDMLRRGYSDFQAQNAANALSNLDTAGIPYAVAIGNHDYDNQFDDLDRHVSSANFAKWFGDARYQPQVTAGEISEYGSSLDQRNHYHVFTVPGSTQKILVLSLEYQIPTAAQQWGQAVINAHSNLPVILSTHEYLSGSVGSRTTGTPMDAAQIGAQNGQSIFNNFVAPNPQIFMVLSGHTGATWNRVITKNTSNVTIPAVIEAAADYEGSQPNGGDGWMQTLQFTLGSAGSVTITNLKPTSATTQTLGSTTTYSVNFATRFALGAAPTPVTPPPNAAPIAPATLGLSTRESTALTFNPLTGATDANGDALKAFPTSLPPRGAIYVNDNGTFTYTPDPKFAGIDSFTYVVSDGKALSALITVSVNVTTAPPVYYYPAAESTVAGTRIGTLASLQASDNIVESISEVITAGFDVDHRYTFSNVLAGADKLLAINAWRSFSNPGTGDEYHPTYSTNGSTWSDLTRILVNGSKDVTRTRFETNEPYQMWILPASLAGTLYIRLTDVNTSGTETVDTLTVDEIFIRALDTQAPSAPVNFTASPASPTSAVLTWTASTDNVGVVAYEVYRVQAGGDVLMATTATLSTTVSGLSTGTAYTFYVSARDAAGNTSSASISATVTTTNPDTQPPTAPAGLTASPASGTTAALAWSASTDDVAVTAYDVYITQVGGDVLVGTTASTTLTVAGLTPGVTYTFYVIARDAAGNASVASNPATATPTADTEAPSAPILMLTATASTSAALAWSAATDNIAVAGYDVYRDGVRVAQGLAGTTFTDTALTINTPYSYFVRASDAAGNFSDSNFVSTTTRLPAPTGLTATKVKTSGNKSGAKLTWVDNSSDETGFKVYSSRNGGAWTLVTTTAANVTTFTTGTLASGTWQFYVAAVNGLYESDPSIGVSLLI